MVVVEEGSSYVGGELRVVVTSALQTSAGTDDFCQTSSFRIGIRNMARKTRVKLCNRCGQTAPILYRVKYQKGEIWVFVCPQCWSCCE